jgi:wobble nucleotide-excising tRNase
LIQRFERILGVGLFHDANGAGHPFKKATLIYAENGRGKSTLASILRSLATGNGGTILNRTTIDGSNDPKVTVQMPGGEKFTFENGAWSKIKKDIVVFDSEFIERNVHSGWDINSDHRKNLLDFAIGELAVAAKREVETIKVQMAGISDELKELKRALSIHSPQMPIEDFVELTAEGDLPNKICALETRLNEVARSAKLLSEAEPVPIELPSLNLDKLFFMLSQTIVDVQRDAEERVLAQVQAIGDDNARSWLNQGIGFVRSDDCPFCGQSVTANSLVAAYSEFFSVGYKQHLEQVKLIGQGVEKRTNEAVVARIDAQVSNAKAASKFWRELINLREWQFDKGLAYSQLSELRALLQRLAAQKMRNPLECVGTSQELQQAKALWQNFCSQLVDVRAAITLEIEEVRKFKRGLTRANLGALQSNLDQLRLKDVRQRPDVVDLCERYVAALARQADAVRRLALSRQKLDQLMDDILKKYCATINALLERFGVSFKISNFGANYRGNSPRSDWSLSLRDHETSQGQGPHSFSTALSDGDKRTLAFALFLAQTLGDPNLCSKCIVVDDPMCSLDINRRRNTQVQLKKLYQNSKQLVLLAHDLYFIRDFRDCLEEKDPQRFISTFQLSRVANDYTDFDKVDIDELCSSTYVKHYRILEAHLRGEPVDTLQVAKSIRPLLEAFLHLRYPGLLNSGMTLGQVLLKIKDASPPSPLTTTQPLVPEL